MKRQTKLRWWVYVVGGVLTSVLGWFLLAVGMETAASILVIFPSSLVGYLVPRSMLDESSESVLFFLGFGLTSGLWAAALLGIHRLWLRATRARSAASASTALTKAPDS